MAVRARASFWKRAVAGVVCDAARGCGNDSARGKTIRKGQAVILSFGSANHDGVLFERPNEFNITRPMGMQHIAFGYGIHFCIGMPLAMMEGPLIIEIVLRRLKNLKLADESKVRWLPNLIERGLTEMPVTFVAAKR